TVLAKNALGKYGAYIGHFFIHNGIGITAFLIPLFLLAIGTKILVKFKWNHLIKFSKHSLFFLLWLPLTMAYLFSNYSILGGAFGYEIKVYLKAIIGGLGTAFVILLAVIAYGSIGHGKILEKVGQFLKNKFAGLLKREKENQENSVPENVIIDDILAPSPPAILESEEEEVSSIIEDLVSDLDSSSEKILINERDLIQEIANNSPESDDNNELTVKVAEEDGKLSENEINEKVKEFGEYDPTLDLAKFELPSIDLLADHGGNEITVSQEELKANSANIVSTLANYKIGIAKISATVGPTVTLYEIVPEAGVRISKIKNLEDDIALSLAALGIRIIAPIPGKGTIGIEVPNSNPDVVSMKTLVASEKFQNSDSALPVVMGKTISNETYTFDLAKMPHLLMAGATGQGKSVGLNAILVSLLYKKHPSQLKFVLVDPKKVELTLFNKIERHYLAKLPDEGEAIITDTSKVVKTLNSLCVEMDQRYELLKTAEVRNIKEYNKKFISRRLNPENGHRYMPYIVLVIDEFADLIMTAGKEVETPIARLAQLARAIGIHLIVATQRPSVNILTGTIKANFPARIAFRVSQKIDSRTILDQGGADQLIGRGDMLLSTGNSLVRLQCGFVDTPEVESICNYIGEQRGYPDAYLLPEFHDENSGGNGNWDDEERDSLFEDAAKVIVMHQQGSTSLIQRKMKLGYNRAGRIMDQLEAAGIVGPSKGSKARDVLIPDEFSLEQFLNAKESIN
ncbi:MAG: DNA translocase FtsK 4TM domain-containing protein, partial [Bacteroidota bacterium]